MPDTLKTAPLPGDVPGVTFEIKKIYARDLSLEVPHAPDIFFAEWKPDTDLNMHNEARRLPNGEYDVALRVTVEASLGGKTAFVAEAQVSGVFAIAGLTTEELQHVLGSVCPGILYPYARELVSDLSVRAGFPQYILAPVNFDALYRRHREERDAAAGDGSGPSSD